MLGRTRYAGAFLLLGHLLDWLAAARDCFADEHGTLTRGLLTSALAPLVGLQRIYHLDEMEDQGFALLSGGRRCPSRHSVGGWRRHLLWYEVDAFCRRTSPWELVRGDDAMVSFDDHVIPRWTRKFHIPKGYVTTRNKSMRCEKLFYSYSLDTDRFLAVRATPGNWGLRDVAVPMVRQVLERGRPRTLHAFFDAGAGKADSDVRALWELAEENPRLDVTLRACRYPNRLRAWQQLPSGLFVSQEEAGECVGAPLREVRVAETETVLGGESEEEGIRTIVCRQMGRGPKGDRWHGLFTTSAGFPEEVLGMYRGRQAHEQGYRVEVHDLNVDAVACGYDKESEDRQRPRFQRGVLQMMGWLIGLVYNAVGEFAKGLVGDFGGSHVRTVRRKFLEREGTLYETEKALIVQMDEFGGQEALVEVIDEFNRKRHRLPWLENREVIISQTPGKQPRSGP